MGWDDARASAAVRAALETAEARGGAGAAAEVLLRRSSGAFLRVTRAGAHEEDEWREEAVAVRVRLASGRGALCACAGWESAESAAARAAALAETSGSPMSLRAAAGRVAPHAAPESVPSVADLAAALAVIEGAALGADARVVAIDSAFLRAGVTESFLASTEGAALHQRQAGAQVHAAAVARDGLRIATHPDAWAGARLERREAEDFGQRLGSAAVLDLVGLATIPRGPMLFLPRAVSEITFAAAPALLGLAPSASVRAAAARPMPAAHPSLRLLEDSALDDARVLPVDGAGRPLGIHAVLESGLLDVPVRDELPLVRAGTADAPAPGWLRLSWGWSPGGLPDEALRERIPAGVIVETAATLALDVPSLTWSGSISGRLRDQGRERAFARVPFSLPVLDLLERAEAGGARASACHPSGTVRAIALLIREAPAGE